MILSEKWRCSGCSHGLIYFALYTLLRLIYHRYSSSNIICCIHWDQIFVWGPFSCLARTFSNCLTTNDEMDGHFSIPCTACPSHSWCLHMKAHKHCRVSLAISMLISTCLQCVYMMDFQILEGLCFDGVRCSDVDLEQQHYQSPLVPF